MEVSGNLLVGGYNVVAVRYADVIEKMLWWKEIRVDKIFFGG